MTNLTSTDPVRSDCRLIAQTLRKLSASRVILRIVVVVAAIALWLYVSSLLLRFGGTLTYASLASMGQQVVDLLVRINPYLWWLAVVLWTLLVFFTVRAWFNSHVDAGNATALAPDEFRQLTARLSTATLDVMRWSWPSHDEPFTFGDLRRTLAETRSGRVDKIAIVREQEAILNGKDTAAAVNPVPLTATTTRAHRIEPGSAPLREHVSPNAANRDAPATTDTPAPTHVEPSLSVAGETRPGDVPRRQVEPRLGNID